MPKIKLKGCHLNKLFCQRKHRLKRTARSEIRFKKILYTFFNLPVYAKRKDVKYLISHQKLFIFNNKGYFVDFYLPRHRIVFNIIYTHQDERQKHKARAIELKLANLKIKTVNIQYKDTFNLSSCYKYIQDAINNNTQRPKITLNRADEVEMQKRFIDKNGITKCPAVGDGRKITPGI